MAKAVGLEKIDISEVKKICEKQGLKPGRVKGTEGVQFTKGRNPNVEVLSWDEFETALKARRLAVFASRPSGRAKTRFMKIMKR
ncbi:MAG: hypothetical protein QMD21_03025 [Candidatus Thermoplasmatota archaeon]|nr:hypothetical protein [Candidatus Thermoplasmatota archaeon]MDI6855742.1 hypothetical protein [Candidatus Thermoplasmatota archaeon]MDI6887868.1 hypothetical protein [Candidatus Thermoplasmatota archaeon]